MSIQQINNGDLGSKARATINSTARAAQMASGGKELIIDTFGDSISGLAESSWLGGVLRAAAFYWAPGLNIQARTAYGVGGSSSSDLISGANPQLTRFQTAIAGGAAIPDVVIIQTLSNDFFTASTAASFTQNLITFTNAVLAMGVPLVIVGSALPKAASGAPQSGRMEANTILRRYADVTPGVMFFDWFSATFNPNAAASSVESPWITALGGYSADNVHPNANAAFAGGRVMAELLSNVAGRVSPRVMANTRYANTDVNTRCFNILGAEGNFQGTSGQLNGVDNAGVAGSAATTNNRWLINAPAGVTVVPSIVTEPDGTRKQRISISGTPSANGSITFNCPHNFLPLAQAAFGIQAILDVTDLTGISRVGLDSSLGAESLGNGDAGVLPPHSGRWFMRRIRTPAIRNASGGATTFSAILGVLNGVPVSGAIELSRCAAFQIAETL